MSLFRGENCVPEEDDEGFVPDGGGGQGFGTKPVCIPEGCTAAVSFEALTSGNGCVDLEVSVVSDCRQFEDGYEPGSEGGAHLSLSAKNARRLAKALLLAADEAEAELQAD